MAIQEEKAWLSALPNVISTFTSSSHPILLQDQSWWKEETHQNGWYMIPVLAKIE